MIRSSFSVRPRPVKRLTLLALLAGLSVAVHTLESLLPPLVPALPGVKLGLANVFSLFALMQYSLRDGLCVGVVRCLIVMLITGSVTGFFYALAGAILSLLAMALLKKLQMSVFFISIAGALAHNTAQVMVAVLVTHTTALFGYLPWLWLCAVPTGLLIAALHKMIDRALKTGGLTHD